jgi:uncharacterized membrane protein YjgN (DUF898 family)
MYSFSKVLLNLTVTMVSKGLRLDLGTKVYRTVHFVHTGYAVDSTQSINTSSIILQKNKTKMYYCSATCIVQLCLA